LLVLKDLHAKWSGFSLQPNPQPNALHSRRHDDEVQLYAFDCLALDRSTNEASILWIVGMSIID
jgi:hypothetical protein